MTPEIMWKFRSLGTFTLSPDGSSVFYTVTDIDLQSETRRTNIFKIATTGGILYSLRATGGTSPQWFNNGKSIAFVNKGNLCTMNADGSEQKRFQVSAISRFLVYHQPGINIFYKESETGSDC